LSGPAQPGQISSCGVYVIYCACAASLTPILLSNTPHLSPPR
jgi:hypothetical protein